MCAVPSCPRPSRAFELCSTHYARFRKHGTAEPEPSPCLSCGEPVAYRRGGARYCGTSCKRKAEYRRNTRESRPYAMPQVCAVRVLACDECAALFTIHHSGTPATCSAECARLRRNRRALARARSFRDEHGVFRSRMSERRRRERIFERDEWTCRLCWQPIDPAARRPDPWAGEVDHRVPLALGGVDEPDNLQAAHGYCNRVKGDRYVA